MVWRRERQLDRNWLRLRVRCRPGSGNRDIGPNTQGSGSSVSSDCIIYSSDTLCLRCWKLKKLLPPSVLTPSAVVSRKKSITFVIYRLSVSKIIPLLSPSAREANGSSNCMRSFLQLRDCSLPVDAEGVCFIPPRNDTSMHRKTPVFNGAISTAIAISSPAYPRLRRPDTSPFRAESVTKHTLGAHQGCTLSVYYATYSYPYSLKKHEKAWPKSYMNRAWTRDHFDPGHSVRAR